MSKHIICKGCGKKNAILSYQGFCDTCSINKVKLVKKQLREKKGYYYKKWKAGLLHAVMKGED